MYEKKVHRFFIPVLPNEEHFTLNEPRLLQQLVRVLRCRVGDIFVLFGEHTDDALVRVMAISKRDVAVRRERVLPAIVPPVRRLVAAVSITKRDTFELVTQKLTELGVDTLVPLHTNHTVKQGIRADRLEIIAREATEQSGRNTLLSIAAPLSLEACLKTFPLPAIVWDAHTVATTTALPKDDRVIMYVGPEGGWSDEERSLFAHCSAQFASLGPTILRSETAAIVGAYELLRTT